MSAIKKYTKSTTTINQTPKQSIKPSTNLHLDPTTHQLFNPSKPIDQSLKTIYNPQSMNEEIKLTAPVMYVCGCVPGEGDTGGGAIKGRQQPVSQIMRQAQQVVCS